MKVILVCALSMVLLPSTALSSDGDAIDRAMKAKDYQVAYEISLENLSRDKKSISYLNQAGDAAFLQGMPVAHDHYTKAWIQELDSAWDATKGDSPVWKVLAVATMALGAAADYQNAKQGISSSLSADGLETGMGLLGSLEEATGDKDSRKKVRQVIRDLKGISRRGTNSYQIIRANWWNSVAGAGMARIHAKTGVCNGVRVNNGTYLASASCISKFGGAVGVSIDTTLKPEDFAVVDQYQSVGNRISLRVPKSGAVISTSSWRPQLSNPRSGATDAYAVTWFAPEFNFIVPMFQTCSSVEFNDCGDIHDNNALLWSRSSGEWRFSGFANPDGTLDLIE